MTTLHPERERRRLAQLYAGMTSEELQSVAGGGSSLTDVARQMLREEIARRGLDIEVRKEPEGRDELEERELVMVRRFRDLPEALLAKGSLESSGIECFMADDNMIRLDWFISNLVGGVKLLVSPEDVEASIAILDQPTPEIFDVEGIGNYQQPLCPKCQSLEVSFEGLNKKVAYISAYFGLPIPLHNTTWNCRSCGHHWLDAEAQTEKSN